MASSAALQSETKLEKRLNSQKKFLLIKLWDYFEQETRKSKISRGDEERSFKARPLSSSQLGLLFIPPCRDFRKRARMDYSKKGRFSMPTKRYRSNSQQPINRHGKYKHS